MLRTMKGMEDYSIGASDGYVNWAKSKIDVNLTRQAIKDSPPYDSATLFTPEREAGIHAHYGRVGFWPADAKGAETDHENKHSLT